MKPENFIANYPAQTFSCSASRFKSYKVEEIDGHLYIIGAGLLEAKKKTFIVDKASSTELLVSLLNLYEQLSPNLLRHVDERITNVDEALIMDWCIRYGTPMESGGATGSPLDDDTIWRKYGKVGFRIADFYARLYDLYDAYMLWRRVGCNDTSKANTHADRPIESCKESLHVRMLTMDVRLRPNFECYPPTITYECGDYMAVAKAHMFFLCVSSDTPYVGVCQVCGKPFAKMRKNNTQCSFCQRTKSQRSRREKRIAEQALKDAEERTD